PLDPARRDRLRAWAAALTPARLAHWAARLDRRFAGGGRQRAGRAVEVALLTGRGLSWWQEHARETGAMRPWYIQLTLPRDVLHRRIAQRVDEMLTGGLVDELRRIFAIVVATRRYAKRQETWFRHQLRDAGSGKGETGNVWTLDATASPDALATRILERWRSATAPGSLLPAPER